MIKNLVSPPALKPGDHVAIIAISSPVDPDVLEMGLHHLTSAGLVPVIYPSAQDSGTVRSWLAGTDHQRATEFVRALNDDSIAGIIFACGGHGAQRVLELIEWTKIDSSNPKVVSGYSDITAILEGVARHLGWASLYAPMPGYVEIDEEYTRTSFLGSLFGSQHSTTLEFSEAQIVTPGTANGITSGGNLAMLVSSLGTNSSWMPESRILMIEDEEESDIRIDRMLTQLRRSGFFESVVGVIAGHFYNCGNPLDVRWVLEDNLGRLGIPVLIGANIGHRGNFQTYPIGIFASLAVEKKVLTLERTALTTQ
jgi:muramoyltetrapeptide carboxypeptidase